MMKKINAGYWLAGLAMSCMFSPVQAENYVALSRDGAQILYLDSSSRTPTIEFFDAQSGVLTHSTPLKVDAAQQLIMGFTPDGFKLAVLEQAGLSIWHNQTGKSLRTLPVDDLPASMASYHPKTAITNASGTAQLFYQPHLKQLAVVHTGNGKLLGKVDIPDKPLALGMDAAGRSVAFVIPDKASQYTLQVYNLYKNQIEKSLPIPKLAGTQQALNQPIIFSADGQFVAWLPYLINVNTAELTTLSGAQQAAFTTQQHALLFANASGLQRYDLATHATEPLSSDLANCQTIAHSVNLAQTTFAFVQHCQQALSLLLVNAQTGQMVKRVKLAKP